MTKLIDTDALLRWCRTKMNYGFNNLDPEAAYKYVPYGSLIEKIQSLAIEFDDDGWCWDITKAPKERAFLCRSENEFYVINYGKCEIEGLGFYDIYGSKIEPTVWRYIPPLPKDKA